MIQQVSTEKIVLSKIRCVNYFLMPGVKKVGGDRLSFIIKTIVCDHVGMTLSELATKSRVAKYSKARHLVMYLMHRFESGLTLSEMGAILGIKNHSSVIFGIKSIKNIVETEKAFKAEVELMEFRIKEFVESN